MSGRHAHKGIARIESARSFKRFAALNLFLFAALIGIGIFYFAGGFAGTNIQTTISQSQPTSVAAVTADQSNTGANVKPDQQLRYNLKAVNNGNSVTSQKVKLTSVLDENVEFVSKSDGVTWDAGSRTLTKDGNEMQAGSTFAMEFTVRVKNLAQYGRTISQSGRLHHGSTDFRAGVINNAITVPAPSTPSLSVSGTTQTSASLRWSASVPQGAYTGISTYIIRNSSGGEISRVSGSTLSYTQGGLGCNQRHSYLVEAVAAPTSGTYGSGSNSSRSGVVTATTSSCPVNPAPNPTPTPTPTPKPPAKPKPTNPGVGGVAPTPDTTAPGVPIDFKAEVAGGGLLVGLSWKAPQDPSGIKNYKLERSMDNSTWTVLSPELTNVTYEDKSIAFKTKYYYRLSATDNAGNTGPYASTIVTTGEFNALGSNATIKSSDGSLILTILPASLEAGTGCSIFSGSAARVRTSASRVVIAGPYELVCKLSTGEEVTKFKSPLSAVVTIPKDKQKKFKDFSLAKIGEGGRAEAMNGKYDKKKQNITFTVAEPTQVAVLGTAKKNLWPGILLTLAVVGGIGGTIFVVLLRRAQKQHYDEYLRRKYYNL